MKILKKIKMIGIEGEFNIVLTVFLLAMLISQIILLSFIEKNTSEQRIMSSDVISRQINTFLNLKLETLNRIKDEVQSEPMVQDILEETDAEKRKEATESYVKKMLEIQSYCPDVFYMAAKRSDGRIEKITPNASASEYEKMKDVMSENTYSSDGVTLFEVNGDAYSDYRYLFVNVPVSKYDFYIYENIDIGSVGICLKVNIRDAFSSDRFNGQYENINLDIDINGEKVNLINSKGNDSHLIYIHGYYITNTDWEITGYVYDHTHNMLIFIRLFVYVCIALIILLMFLFRKIMINEILKPISTIREYLTKHGLNGKDGKLEIDGNKDIKELADSINKMYERLRDDAHKIFDNQRISYEKEILNVETQLRLLQNQVNPHFIYNIFETIRAIASVYDAKEICTIVRALNAMLRYNLNSDSRVKVSEEIEIILRYIEIMTIRYDDAFTFEYKCDSETGSASVLKMICQPIIENCFSHGFKSDGSKLNICMKIDSTDDKVIISIQDDGKGITPQKRNEILKNAEVYSPGAGIGISNLVYRLGLCYGGNFDFQILSEENVYTIINITVPKEADLTDANE